MNQIIERIIDFYREQGEEWNNGIQTLKEKIEQIKIENDKATTDDKDDDNDDEDDGDEDTDMKDNYKECSAEKKAAKKVNGSDSEHSDIWKFKTQEDQIGITLEKLIKL